jgi:hypothetical protein
MGAGKGDKPRPINKKEFDTNFDKIKWNKKEKPIPVNGISKKGKTIYVYK